MIQWILEHLGIVVVIVLFIAQMVRGIMQQTRDAQRRETRRDPVGEDQRVRDVQEQIRRQIAARRARQATTESPPPLEREPELEPVPRAETTQMPEPFGGGPLGKMLEELQRRAQQHIPVPPPAPPPLVAERRNIAEIERQERIAEELRAAEEARRVAQRRAAQVAAANQRIAQGRVALRQVARERLLADLSDPQSLRRAFVLREVLGTPVGMR